MTLRITGSKFWHRDYTVPLCFSSAFLVLLFNFVPQVYGAVVVAYVLTIQIFPFSSRMSRNLVFFSLPVIGAIANYHHLCLTYNSTVLFLWTRAFAMKGRIGISDVLLYFSVIATWLLYRGAPGAIYAGGIMHGVMHPLHFLLLKSRFNIVRKLVFVIPIWWGIDNVIQYKQYFTAFWDFEIFSTYFGWALGYDKETVVKRVFLASLPLITWAQIYWDVCPVLQIK